MYDSFPKYFFSYKYDFPRPQKKILFSYDFSKKISKSFIYFIKVVYKVYMIKYV